MRQHLTKCACSPSIASLYMPATSCAFWRYKRAKLRHRHQKKIIDTGKASVLDISKGRAQLVRRDAQVDDGEARKVQALARRRRHARAPRLRAPRRQKGVQVLVAKALHLLGAWRQMKEVCSVTHGKVRALVAIERLSLTGCDDCHR